MYLEICVELTHGQPEEHQGIVDGLVPSPRDCVGIVIVHRSDQNHLDRQTRLETNTVIFTHSGI